MISLLVSFVVLIAGYLLYGRVTEKIFSPDDRETPAVAVNDGVDCVPMKTWGNTAQFAVHALLESYSVRLPQKSYCTPGILT